MTYSLRNIFTKNYCNQTTTVKIIIGGCMVYFFDTQCIMTVYLMQAILQMLEEDTMLVEDKSQTLHLADTAPTPIQHPCHSTTSWEGAHGTAWQGHGVTA